MAWNFGRMNSRDVKDYLHTINSQKKTITKDHNITDFKTHRNIRDKSLLKDTNIF